jgi:uncharacterized membrane-anchored protein
LGLASAAFGSTLSWVRIEEDEVEGARRSLFPAEVCWKRTGGIEEEWRTEEHDAEIVCFRRSIRRGSTAQTRNERVSKDVIDGNNRWRAEEAAKGGRAATFGGDNVRRRYDGEIIHGRESSCRELATILGSVVDPGAATSTSAQVSRDQQCGRGKTGGG